MNVNLAGGGADVYRCVKCGQYWCANSGARDSFSVVTKWCPDCVAQMPAMGRFAA